MEITSTSHTGHHHLTTPSMTKETTSPAHLSHSQAIDVTVDPNDASQDDCLPISVFGKLDPEENNLPKRLLNVAPLLLKWYTHFKSKNWTIEFQEALQSIFSHSLRDIKNVLRKDIKDLSFVEVLLHFYQFFRGVHRCSKEGSFVDRIRRMPADARHARKNSIYYQSPLFPYH